MKFQENNFGKEANYPGLVYAIVITCIIGPLLHMLGIGMAALTE